MKQSRRPFFGPVMKIAEKNLKFYHQNETQINRASKKQRFCQRVAYIDSLKLVPLFGQDNFDQGNSATLTLLPKK